MTATGAKQPERRLRNRAATATPMPLSGRGCTQERSLLLAYLTACNGRGSLAAHACAGLRRSALAAPRLSLVGSRDANERGIAGTAVVRGVQGEVTTDDDGGCDTDREDDSRHEGAPEDAALLTARHPPLLSGAICNRPSLWRKGGSKLTYLLHANRRVRYGTAHLQLVARPRHFAPDWPKLLIQLPGRGLTFPMRRQERGPTL